MPAKNTAFRIVSDSKGKVNVSAIAVFSEKKPYLQFFKRYVEFRLINIDIVRTIGEHVSGYLLGVILTSLLLRTRFVNWFMARGQTEQAVLKHWSALQSGIAEAGFA